MHTVTASKLWQKNRWLNLSSGVALNRRLYTIENCIRLKVLQNQGKLSTYSDFEGEREFESERERHSCNERKKCFVKSKRISLPSSREEHWHQDALGVRYIYCTPLHCSGNVLFSRSESALRGTKAAECPLTFHSRFSDLGEILLALVHDILVSWKVQIIEQFNDVSFVVLKSSPHRKKHKHGFVYEWYYTE